MSGREKRFDENFQEWVAWYIFLSSRLICSIISSCWGNEPALLPRKDGADPRSGGNRAYPTDYPRVSQDLHRVKFPDVKEGKPSETTIRRKLYYHYSWFSYHYSRQRISVLDFGGYDDSLSPLEDITAANRIQNSLSMQCYIFVFLESSMQTCIHYTQSHCNSGLFHAICLHIYGYLPFFRLNAVKSLSKNRKKRKIINQFKLTHEDEFLHFSGRYLSPTLSYK